MASLRCERRPAAAAAGRLLASVLLLACSGRCAVAAGVPDTRPDDLAERLQQLHLAHFREVQEATERAAKECAGRKCAGDEAEAAELQVSKAVTDRLPLSRVIPDTRPPACHTQKHAPWAGNVSVILVFNREATSTLLRTAQSVLDRTPSEKLLEVLLVMDGPSAAPSAAKQKAEIKTYCKKNPKVRLIRLQEHKGLAPAKNAGAKAAKGDLLVFLDSHCEVNAGWLEPLTDAIVANRHAVVIPNIDEISASNFMYSTGAPARGVFTWGMYYAGQPYSPEEEQLISEGKRVTMPIMPGGLFAIDRAFFAELGYYDEGLRIWGAENIELSLKTWRCGGRIELAPCSRVGHVYRSVGHRFPPGESLHKNFRRIVDVWMDDYKKYYYTSFPEAAFTDPGDLTEALAARRRLKCESMDWFLEHVYPTMFVPRNPRKHGVLASASGEGCIETRGVQIASNPRQEPHVAPVFLDRCTPLGNNFYLMKDTGRLVHIGIWTEQCLGVHSIDDYVDETVQEAPVMVCQCATYPDSGCSEDEIRWEWEPKTRRLRHVDSGRCLAVANARNDDGSGILVAARDCKLPNKRVQWDFVSHAALARRLRSDDDWEDEDEAETTKKPKKKTVQKNAQKNVQKDVQKDVQNDAHKDVQKDVHKDENKVEKNKETKRAEVDDDLDDEDWDDDDWDDVEDTTAKKQPGAEEELDDEDWDDDDWDDEDDEDWDDDDWDDDKHNEVEHHPNDEGDLDDEDWDDDDDDDDDDWDDDDDDKDEPERAEGKARDEL